MRPLLPAPMLNVLLVVVGVDVFSGFSNLFRFDGDAARSMLTYSGGVWSSMIPVLMMMSRPWSYRSWMLVKIARVRQAMTGQRGPEAVELRTQKNFAVGVHGVGERFHLTASRHPRLRLRACGSAPKHAPLPSPRPCAV